MFYRLDDKLLNLRYIRLIYKKEYEGQFGIIFETENNQKFIQYFDSKKDQDAAFKTIMNILIYSEKDSPINQGICRPI